MDKKTDPLVQLIWMFLGNIMVGTWNIPPFTFAFNFTATIFFIACVSLPLGTLL
jgi:hypothetical protein